MPEQVELGYDDLHIDLRDIYAEMGYGDDLPAEYVERSVMEVIGQLQSRVRARYYYQIFGGEWSKDSLVIQGAEFRIGRMIATQLRKSEQFALFVATAGMEYHHYLEKVKREGDLFRPYLIDSIGSVIAERTADKLEQELTARIVTYGLKHTNRFSPGYCGWHVGEQQIFFSLLPQQVCGIVLTDSSLMVPVKSVSGIIGVGKNVGKKDYACSLCDYKSCYKRKG